MGRRTYEAAIQRLGEKAFSGMKVIAFSRTLKPEDHQHITVISELRADWVQFLKNQAGKDIWLFGGSQLFGAFLRAGYVDTVEVTVIPVLLGDGVPLFEPPYKPTKLKLSHSKIYRSGGLSLSYDVAS